MKKINKHRRSIRIPGFDYAQAGAYFITLVTQNRMCLFGEINNGEMILSDAGFMVDKVCKEIPDFLPGVEMDHYQIMPNHFHGIIVLNPIEIGYVPKFSVGADLRVCPTCTLRAGQPLPPFGGQGRIAPTQNSISLFDVVQRFKSLTTRRYIDGVNNQNWLRFNKRLWQRNYYERVIRNEREHQALVDYIYANPNNWDKDQENHSYPNH